MNVFKRLRILLALVTALSAAFSQTSSVFAGSVEAVSEQSEEAGEQAASSADGAITPDVAKSIVQTYTDQLASVSAFSEEELLYLDDVYGGQTDFYGTLASAVADGCGTFKSCDNIRTQKTDEEGVVKVKADCQFSKKELVLTLTVKCYDNLGPVVSSTALASADDEKPMSEKLKEAGMNTVVGMGTVFVILIIISLIISCFSFIPKIQAKIQSRKDGAVSEPEPFTERIKDYAVTDTSSGEENGGELVAVIAAAVATAEGKPADHFIVRSIRRRR